jgi:hypothetical protein
MTLSIPSGAGGQPIQQITADWPANFADGQPHQIIIQGQPIQVTFEKIGDIP